MKKIYTSMLVAFSLSLGALSQISWAEAGAHLGGSEKPEKFGSSELLNALFAMQGEAWSTTAPIPKAYRDENRILNNKSLKVQEAYKVVLKTQAKQRDERRSSFYPLENGESILLNAFLYYQSVFRGKDIYTEFPQPPGMTKENARDYIIALIKENKNDCVNDHYREGALHYSPLYCAMELGDLELLQLLIDNGSSLKEDDILSVPEYYQSMIVENKDPKMQSSLRYVEEARKKQALTIKN